jgi:ubiquinol-cytochrome c reductase cytochrome c subunit
MRFGILVSATLGLTLLAASSLVFAQGSAPPGDAKAGAATFMRVGCYECHGTVGQGSGRHGVGAYGPMLAPKPLPFAAVIAQLRRPRNLMPSYSAAILSDQDVADIYAYLVSVPAGKSAKDIPLLHGYPQP